MSALIVGYPFDGAVGLKTGKNLEDMVALAKFAPASTMLDQIAIEEDANGKAQLKDLGITLAKLSDSMIGDGLEKSGIELAVVVDDVTLEITGGALQIKDSTTGVLVDDVSLESYDSGGGIMKLRVKALGVDTTELALEAVDGTIIAPASVDFSHWDVEVLTETETPPVSLAEGKLHIIYEVV